MTHEYSADSLCGEVVSRKVHNLEVAGSTPAAANSKRPVVEERPNGVRPGAETPACCFDQHVGVFFVECGLNGKREVPEQRDSWQKQAKDC